MYVYDVNIRRSNGTGTAVVHHAERDARPRLRTVRHPGLHLARGTPAGGADRLAAVAPAPARIKVLHVITRFQAGAGGNTLLSAVGLDPERYEVWIAGVPGGGLWERARAAGVHTVELCGFRHTLTPADLLVLARLVRLMRRERFTVVHTHSAKGGFLGRLAARLCRTPVVVHTFHGLSFHPYQSRSRRTVYRCLERATRRFTHGFLAVAPAWPGRPSRNTWPCPAWCG